MNKALLKELMELSPEERIQLAEDLWDSIAQDELPPLTDAQRKESTDESKSMSGTHRPHCHGRKFVGGYGRTINEWVGFPASGTHRHRRGRAVVRGTG